MSQMLKYDDQVKHKEQGWTGVVVGVKLASVDVEKDSEDENSLPEIHTLSHDTFELVKRKDIEPLVRRAQDFPPGTLYEDCKFHPMMCLHVDVDEFINVNGDPWCSEDIYGVSLIDGKISSCSLHHCGVRKLTNEQAAKMITQGPDWEEYYSNIEDAEERKEAIRTALDEWPVEHRWWLGNAKRLADFVI
jgi:hypothetical protein